jgi:UDP-N-acetylmuramoyl-L-alanyl-D-glutamate--2,6-diaminopimelate ligase
MSRTLKQLVNALPFPCQWLPADVEDMPVAGVIDDNRKIQPGYVFVAYPGVVQDGHTYISDAIRRGAVAVVCEHPQPGLNVPQVIVPNGRQALAYLCAAWHGFPTRSLTLVGITGTDGKTTTTNLLFNILKSASIHTGMISTVNAVIGERVLDTGLHTTTPDADEVQGYLAQMRDAGMTHCILEVTSHSLAQYRVDGIDVDVAVVTNITHEHLDLHGSYEAYRAAKGRLFEMLSQPVPAERHKPRLARTAVLNGDDAFSFDYLRSIPAERRLIYRLERTARERADQTVRLLRVTHEPAGMHLWVGTPRGEIELWSKLIGNYNISNILATVSAAIALDISTDAICAGINTFQSVPGRMERIDLGQPYTAIVDFAHTPNALDQLLRALRSVTPGRLIVVFGCAGERDVQKRPMMGRLAAETADVVVLTAEDPRRENLESILDQIEAGITSTRAEVRRMPDRAEAIRLACSLAQAGDTVVSCGKGHEQSMCFGTTETPWDDREAMREAIKRILDS